MKAADPSSTGDLSSVWNPTLSQPGSPEHRSRDSSRFRRRWPCWSRRLPTPVRTWPTLCDRASPCVGRTP